MARSFFAFAVRETLLEPRTRWNDFDTGGPRYVDIHFLPPLPTASIRIDRQRVHRTNRTGPAWSLRIPTSGVPKHEYAARGDVVRTRSPGLFIRSLIVRRLLIAFGA